MMTRTQYFWLFLSGLILAGCAGPRPTSTSTPTSTRWPRLTPTADDEPSPTATVFLGRGPSHIYLVRPDGSDLRLLAPGTSPQFSGDGRYLSFLQDQDGRESLVLYDRHSGVMRPLSLGGNPYQVVWSPDSAHLAAVIGGDREALALIDPAGGAFQRVADMGTAGPILWSPDSKSIAWVQSPPDDPDRSHLWLYDLAADRSRDLYTHTGSICPLAWPDRGSIYALAWARSYCEARLHSFDPEMPAQVYRVDTGGAGGMQLTHLEDLPVLAKMSPRGDLLAYSEYTKNGRSALHLLDLQTGVEKAPVALSEVMIDFIWSPDGRFVAVGGDMELGMVDVASLSYTGLTEGVATYWPEGWSPDGRHVLVGADCCGVDSVFYVDIDGHDGPHKLDTPLRADPPPAFSSQGAVWSPEGEWIAFVGFQGCASPCG